MSLFETKNLVVTSAMIAKCHEVSVKEYFIDNKDGKGITSAKTLDEAIEFAKVYQNMIG